MKYLLKVFTVFSVLCFGSAGFAAEVEEKAGDNLARMAQFAGLVGKDLAVGAATEVDGKSFTLSKTVVMGEATTDLVEGDTTGLKLAVFDRDDGTERVVSISGTQNLLHVLLDLSMAMEGSAEDVAKAFSKLLPTTVPIPEPLLIRAMEALKASVSGGSAPTVSTASPADTLLGAVVEATKAATFDATVAAVSPELHGVYKLLRAGDPTEFKAAIDKRFNLALAQTTKEIEEAVATAPPGARIIIAGHSLGGALSTFGALEAFKSNAFEGHAFHVFAACSPGTETVMKWKDMGEVPPEFLGRVTNVGREGDLVFHGTHVGTTYTLPPWEVEERDAPVPTATPALGGWLSPTAWGMWLSGSDKIKPLMQLLQQLLENHRLANVIADLQAGKLKA